MSFFNDAQIHGLETGEYPCPECGALMNFEDEWEETLICPECGYEVNSERYGFTDEEYEALYPTKEEVCGYGDEDEDEYNGEYYEEVYGELSDD